MSSVKAVLSTGFQSEGELVKVGSVPYPKINDDQILIKAKSFAVNPTDWKHLTFAEADYIVGSDVSGVVEEVGSKVEGFTKGDVVSSFIRGNVSSAKGAFTEYVIAEQNSTIKYGNGSKFSNEGLKPGSYPTSLIDTYEGASSVTLGLCTVALSFVNLGIKFGDESNSTKSILIWSGSTATGVLAIQVAKLVFGLKVITTASPKNHDFLKSLGADAVFDYHDTDVSKQIRDFAGDSIAYALDTISSEYSFQHVYDSTANSSHVAIDNLLGLQPLQIKTDENRKVSYSTTLAYLIWGQDIDLMGTIFKSSTQLVENYNDLFVKILPSYISKLKHSNLRVLNPGLETASEALELLRQNKVSGEKVVFSLN